MSLHLLDENKEKHEPCFVCSKRDDETKTIYLPSQLITHLEKDHIRHDFASILDHPMEFYFCPSCHVVHTGQSLLDHIGTCRMMKHENVSHSSTVQLLCHLYEKHTSYDLSTPLKKTETNEESEDEAHNEHDDFINVITYPLIEHNKMWILLCLPNTPWYHIRPQWETLLRLRGVSESDVTHMETEHWKEYNVDGQVSCRYWFSRDMAPLQHELCFDRHVPLTSSSFEHIFLFSDRGKEIYDRITSCHLIIQKKKQAKREDMLALIQSVMGISVGSRLHTIDDETIDQLHTYCFGSTFQTLPRYEQYALLMDKLLLLFDSSFSTHNSLNQTIHFERTCAFDIHSSSETLLYWHKRWSELAVQTNRNVQIGPMLFGCVELRIPSYQHYKGRSLFPLHAPDVDLVRSSDSVIHFGCELCSHHRFDLSFKSVLVEKNNSWNTCVSITKQNHSFHMYPPMDIYFSDHTLLTSADHVPTNIIYHDPSWYDTMINVSSSEPSLYFGHNGDRGSQPHHFHLHVTLNRNILLYTTITSIKTEGVHVVLDSCIPCIVYVLPIHSKSTHERFDTISTFFQLKENHSMYMSSGFLSTSTFVYHIMFFFDQKNPIITPWTCSVLLDKDQSMKDASWRSSVEKTIDKMKTCASTLYHEWIQLQKNKTKQNFINKENESMFDIISQRIRKKEHVHHHDMIQASTSWMEVYIRSDSVLSYRDQQCVKEYIRYLLDHTKREETGFIANGTYGRVEKLNVGTISCIRKQVKTKAYFSEEEKGFHIGEQLSTIYQLTPFLCMMYDCRKTKTLDMYMEYAHDSVTLSQWLLDFHKRPHIDRLRTIQSICVQIHFFLHVSQRTIGFMHNDLHENNILLVPARTWKRKTVSFLVDRCYYSIPIYDYLIKIIDFGNASTLLYPAKIFATKKYREANMMDMYSDWKTALNSIHRYVPMLKQPFEVYQEGLSQAIKNNIHVHESDMIDSCFFKSIQLQSHDDIPHDTYWYHMGGLDYIPPRDSKRSIPIYVLSGDMISSVS